MAAGRVSGDQTLRKLREICLALPETSETLTWGHPNFRAGKKIFAAFHEDAHGSPCIWLRVEPAVLLAFEGDERISPARHGGLRWIGLRADLWVDWDMARDLVVESYRLVALKRLVKKLDEAERGRSRRSSA